MKVNTPAKSSVRFFEWFQIIVLSLLLGLIIYAFIAGAEVQRERRRHEQTTEKMLKEIQKIVSSRIACEDQMVATRSANTK